MGVKPGKKSIGGNTSIGGGKPKTPDNTRKVSDGVLSFPNIISIKLGGW